MIVSDVPSNWNARGSLGRRANDHAHAAQFCLGCIDHGKVTYDGSTRGSVNCVYYIGRLAEQAIIHEASALAKEHSSDIDTGGQTHIRVRKNEAPHAGRPQAYFVGESLCRV